MDCLEHPPPVQQIPPGIPPGGRVTSPIPAVQGVTDYGTLGYTGPCPPHGQMIRYLFKVYGLNTMLDLAAGSNKHRAYNSDERACDSVWRNGRNMDNQVSTTCTLRASIA